MSHIGNANKKVSDTARTDGEYWYDGDYVPSGFARQLERELNAANERVKRMEEMYEGEIGENEQFLGSNLQGLLIRELNWSKERIKRLEEALAAYQKAYTPDGHIKPHDCFATGPRTGDPIQDLVVCPGCWAEQKAKEAKPCIKQLKTKSCIYCMKVECECSDFDVSADMGAKG